MKKHFIKINNKVLPIQENSEGKSFFRHKGKIVKIENKKTSKDNNLIHHLRNEGYYGFALSKQHYTGQESCLKAYNKHNYRNELILVQQFSDFFAFRMENEK